MDGLDPSNSGIINKEEKTLSRSDEEDPIEDEEGILPLYMDYLTPRMMHVLKNELNETAENKENGLKALKELISKERNLFCRPGDDFLLQFLRAKKYDVNKAFKLLQNYYIFEKDLPDIYDISEAASVAVCELVLKSYLGLLTERSRSGSTVLIFKLGMWNPEVDSFQNVFRAIALVFSSAIEIPATQICGYSAIVDFRHLSRKQLKYCTPSNTYRLIHSNQTIFPGHYKDIHILSENKLFHIIWATIYSFLSDKLRKRVHLYGKDLSGLLKYFHPSVLPVEFGGEGPPFEMNSLRDTVYEVQKSFLYNLKYGYK